jgi:gluconolactonase
MERVRLQRFIDLAKPPVPPGEVAESATASEAPERVSRRNFLRAGAAAIAAVTGMAPEAFARNFGPGADPTRYPEPDVVDLDPRFKYKLGNTPIVRLYTGTMWAEGCAWNGAGRYLVWSDIPNDECLRWSEEDGHVGRRFRFPAGNSNGNTFDYSGRQIAFCHGTRNVIRYEHDGTVTVLADKSDEGKELNAPNDGMVHPNDGSIWFTDPGYGALMNYEGKRYNTGSPRPFIKEAVYRIDAQSKKVTKVTDEPFKPNGMCFSQDYKKVYIADTGSSHYPQAKPIIWVYDVDGQTLRNGKTFADMTLNGKAGNADGLRVDEDGNVWAGMGWVGDGYDGVHVFAPDGKRIGQIRLPEICGNITFGGSKRNRLFMAASQSLYAVYVETRGAHIT